jgi:hypothetical protein
MEKQMNPISNEFANELNASEWMGVVYEAGFGIPFQSNYLNISGASKTILFTGCLYNKAFQPVLKRPGGGFQRSVSNQMVESVSEMFAGQAETTILLDMESDHEGGSSFESAPPIFALTVSGAQSGSDYRGASHGWVNIGVITQPGTIESQPVVEHYAFHFFNHKTAKAWVAEEEFSLSVPQFGRPVGSWEVNDVTREEVGSELTRFIQWFMEKVLLNKYESWSEAIYNMPSSDIVRIDVIRANDITIAEHLQLVSDDTPLVYDAGEFKRPVDYFRNYNSIYRGSFNPVTLTHTNIGEGSLFEISLNNIRKDPVPLSEIADRISEIEATGNPVLITAGLPAFVQLDDLLISRGGKPFRYIVGVDTFNAIVADKYNPTPNYLTQFYLDGSSFIVVPRDGMEVATNYRVASVKWEYYMGEYDQTISSTRVRNGELELVPVAARELVAKRLGINYDGLLSID